MRSLLLEFHLGDVAALDPLLHELNLHQGVEARPRDDHDRTPGGPVVLLVALPDSPSVVWEVRSAVTLFDPSAVEQRGGHER